MSVDLNLITRQHYVIIADFPQCDESGRPILYNKWTGRPVPLNAAGHHTGRGEYKYEKNYFVGITAQDVPKVGINPSGKLYLNLWDIKFERLEIGKGVFTRGDAESWMKKIGIEGMRLVRYFDAFKSAK